MTQKNSNFIKKLLYVLFSFCLLVGFLVVLFKGLSFDPKLQTSVLINKSAVNFSAKLLQGKDFLNDKEKSEVALKDFDGKILVLNFWASWCLSCREEAHELETFWQRHKSDGKIYVVGIALQDTSDEALEFAKTLGKTYILGLDPEGKIAIDYGVTGVPETFVIDQKGIIKFKETGPVTAQLLETAVSEIGSVR